MFSPTRQEAELSAQLISEHRDFYGFLTTFALKLGRQVSLRDGFAAADSERMRREVGNVIGRVMERAWGGNLLLYTKALLRTNLNLLYIFLNSHCHLKVGKNAQFGSFSLVPTMAGLWNC